VSPANICGVNSCLADEFNAKNNFDRFPILSMAKDLGPPKNFVGGRYVVLHSRSEGFFDRSYHANRNPSTQSIKVVVRELLDAGFSVVRIGHSNMPSLNIGDPQFMDLTKEARTSAEDFGLIYNAEFFVGSASGPMSLASQLGKKILMFDSFPTGHIRHNAHHILREYKNFAGDPISFRDLVYGDLRGLYSPEALSAKNVLIRQPCDSVIAEQTRCFISGEIPDTHKWIENRTASFSEIPC
jgi:putative glycosyltransferase (TIGR04372 family)